MKVTLIGQGWVRIPTQADCSRIHSQPLQSTKLTLSAPLASSGPRIFHVMEYPQLEFQSLNIVKTDTSHNCLLLLIPSYKPLIPPLAWTRDSPLHCPPSLHPGPQSPGPSFIRGSLPLPAFTSHNRSLTQHQSKVGLKAQDLEADNPGLPSWHCSPQENHLISLDVCPPLYLIKLGNQMRHF